jgi:dTDP-4-dehydrorhamnose reductase
MPLSEKCYPILVTGARGLLGRALAPHLEGGEVRLTDLEELDVTNEAAVRGLVRALGPRTIFHLAAWTDVDGAESHPDAVRRLNVDATAHVARAAAEAGALLVHMSTDFIFDGTKQGLYVEEDPPSPLGVYAAGKAESEQVVRAILPDGHLIVRTAWLYGAGRRNFVDAVLAAGRAAATAADPKPIRVVTDQVGNPTWSKDLARAMIAMVSVAHGGPMARGTFHACGAGGASRYELAREALAAAGLRVPVEPITSADLPTRARRPLRAVLSTVKLERAIGAGLPPWRDSVREYVREQTVKSEK